MKGVKSLNIAVTIFFTIFSIYNKISHNFKKCTFYIIRLYLNNNKFDGKMDVNAYWFIASLILISMSFSQDSMSKLFKRTCNIVDLNRVLIIFSLEIRKWTFAYHRGAELRTNTYTQHTNLGMPLRPFPGRTLNDKRRIFNNRLSRARRYIECSFRILSKKWGVFQTSMLVEPSAAVTITKACYVLHNFVRRRDGYNFEDTLNLSFSMESVTERQRVGNIHSNAKDVRQYFVKYVNNPIHALRWQNKIIGKLDFQN